FSNSDVYPKNQLLIKLNSTVAEAKEIIDQCRSGELAQICYVQGFQLYSIGIIILYRSNSILDKAN
ncbi:MAG: hypothetical protein ABI683_05600, partial [Ginsengibacter sp.]